MAEQLLQIEEGLEERFLFEEDSDSLHILLSMIDYRHKFLNFRPAYLLMRQISISLKRFLRPRKDRDYILHAVKRLVHDDINRFELAVVLKGYGSGLQASDCIDRLERLALKEYSADQLERMQLLYHQAKKGEVMGLQSKLFFQMKEDTKRYRELRKFASFYCRRVLRKKILQLNESLDAQIVLDFDDLSQLKMEEGVLTIQEINDIYQRLSRYLYNNVAKVYKYAYWNGINDAVLERYR